MSFANCRQCGVVLLGKRAYNWCSEPCRKRYQYLHPSFPKRTCSHCGKEYQPKQKGHITYCSRNCSDGASKQGHWHSRTCEQCEREYKPKSGNQRWCATCVDAKRNMCAVYFPTCIECRCIYTAKRKPGTVPVCGHYCSQARSQRKYSELLASAKADRIPKRVISKCKQCNRETLQVGSGHRMYCELCSKLRDRQHRKNNKWLRMVKGIGRKVFGLEPVDVQQIYERDGWRCGICHNRVDPKLQAPHRMSKTIDHIVPLSKGGTHEPRNVRLAHYGCNSSRGNRGTAQLRLM